MNQTVLMKFLRACTVAALLGAVLFTARVWAADGQWVHAYAAYGEPKYPKGFAHF